MLNGWPAGGIWLSMQPTDMRKSFDGLSGLVRNHLRDDPLSGRWFVFINRRRTILKILAFEAGGFWVWGKRLEGGLFARAGSVRGAQDGAFAHRTSGPYRWSGHEGGASSQALGQGCSEVENSCSGTIFIDIFHMVR